MTTLSAAPRRLSALAALDRLGLLIAAAIAWGALFQPFALFKANRIVPGEGVLLPAALPLTPFLLFALVLGAAGLIALLRTPTVLRLAAGLGGAMLGLWMIGLAGTTLTPAGDSLARVSPAAGFWIIEAGLALLAVDALSRLHPRPLVRLALLAAVLVLLAAFLASGTWNALSPLKEYAGRADAFWREARTHLLLAFGALLAATIAGVPLGLLAQRRPRLRSALLGVLNAVQTIPSIALFGLMIAPLAFIAANVPGASALGIAGIGPAPAFIALFGYSLLPVVANTLAGLDAVPASVNDAAAGMGMTDRQRLLAVELPLAFPIILTAIRIVLVQNIGMATIAGLIGGGGFGVFVFQGIGQTALDLVLLGAIPTVLIAMSAAIVLDALVELSRRQHRP